MWLFVFFDLPVDTEARRKAHAKFRRDLLKLGFSMLQYSVYMKHFPTREKAANFIKKIIRLAPSEGKISILQVTDAQFKNIVNIWNVPTSSRMSKNPTLNHPTIPFLFDIDDLTKDNNDKTSNEQQEDK
ncbi:MAG: CRISPR-associated endonuclease Cas2 [Chlorobi bacterium]|nr:CRISPR-associated endonuclease Cas2 [Chlorobiota bacterium]